jgi:5-methylcytosine-specific restriction endonuclease McrA
MKHLQNVTNKIPLPFKCGCGKQYTHRQSLYTHKKKCDYMQQPTTEDTAEKKNIENQEMRKLIKEMRKEINELKTKVYNIKDKSTNCFKILRQCRRKINKDIRNELIIKQDNKCNDCNNVLSQYYQVDHITALQYGGNDDFDNLQALCCECHAKKSSIENIVRDKIRNAIVDIIKTESVSSTTESVSSTIMSRCEVCAKTFSSKNSYTRHINSKSHNMRKEKSIKLFICSCGRMFKQPPSLSRHKKKCNYSYR